MIPPNIMRKRKIADDGGAPSKRVHRTRSVTADPGKTCFLTAELLENIIVRLSPQEIVASQRVSRQFRDIVRTSVMIQEKLFVRCRGDKDLVWELDHRRKSFIKAAQSGAEHELGRVTQLQPEQRDSQSILRLVPVRLNPSLAVSTHIYRAGEPAVRRLRHTRGEFVSFLSQKAMKERLASLVGGKSWQLQHLTDPPCTSARVRIYWKTDCGPRRVATGRLDRCLQDLSGLTFGHLWHAIWSQRDDFQYWTGSRFHYVRQGTLGELRTKLQSEGFKTVENFHIAESEIILNNIVIPSEEEWLSVEQKNQSSKEVTDERADA